MLYYGISVYVLYTPDCNALTATNALTAAGVQWASAAPSLASSPLGTTALSATPRRAAALVEKLPEPQGLRRSLPQEREQVQ